LFEREYLHVLEASFLGMLFEDLAAERGEAEL
jgi:hypothetical protein